MPTEQLQNPTGFPSRRLRHVPVLLHEELQRLLVGEHHVRVQAEVVVARSVLAAEVPKEDGGL